MTPWSVHGILPARILEWVPISFSGGLPDPEIESGSPALQADSLPFELPGRPSIQSALVQYLYFKPRMSGSSINTEVM